MPVVQTFCLRGGVEWIEYGNRAVKYCNKDVGEGAKRRCGQVQVKKSLLVGEE